MAEFNPRFESPKKNYDMSFKKNVSSSTTHKNPGEDTSLIPKNKKK